MGWMKARRVTAVSGIHMPLSKYQMPRLSAPIVRTGDAFRSQSNVWRRIVQVHNRHGMGHGIEQWTVQNRTAKTKKAGHHIYHRVVPTLFQWGLFETNMQSVIGPSHGQVLV